MSINKLLCKYLDSDNKGYATIGDFIVRSGAFVAAFVIIVIYAHGATIVVGQSTSDVADMVSCSVFDVFAISIFTDATFFAIGTVLIMILWHIFMWVDDVWHVEIARCTS